MTSRVRRPLALAFAAALVAACAPASVRPPPPDPNRVYTLAEVDSLPRMRNPTDFRRQIERSYFVIRRDQPDPHVAVYSVEVARDGRIRDVRISHSAGSPRADSVVIHLLDRARFSPARIDTVAVRVRFEFPIEFGGPRRVRPSSP